MMMVLKRKEILVSALIVLIGAAALVNYNYNKKAAEEKAKIAMDTQIEEMAESYNVSAVDSADEVKMMGEAQQVTASADEEVDYFSQAKLSRESARSKKLEILNEVVSSEQSDEEAKAEAQKDIMETAEFSDKESVCENLIVAKGFENAVVFINDENVTVTVKADNFDADSAAVIQEIVAVNTGIQTKYIKIVAV